MPSSRLTSVRVREAGRLVHEDQPGFGREAPADGDDLALRDGEVGDERRRIEPEVEPREGLFGERPHAAVAHRTGQRAEMALDRHVLGDAEVLKQRTGPGR